MVTKPHRCEKEVSVTYLWDDEKLRVLYSLWLSTQKPIMASRMGEKAQFLRADTHN